MISFIVKRVCFVIQFFFSFILIWNSMCRVLCVFVRACVCMCVYMITF